MNSKASDRVLSRLGARTLTREEAEVVAGSAGTPCRITGTHVHGVVDDDTQCDPIGGG